MGHNFNKVAIGLAILIGFNHLYPAPMFDLKNIIVGSIIYFLFAHTYDHFFNQE
jgi:hypothetical protein